jgi:hypothetical protein
MWPCLLNKLSIVNSYNFFGAVIVQSLFGSGSGCCLVAPPLGAGHPQGASGSPSTVETLLGFARRTKALLHGLALIAAEILFCALSVS